MKIDRTPIADQPDRAPAELDPADWLRIADAERDARRQRGWMYENAQLLEACITRAALVAGTILLASMLFAAVPVFFHQAQTAPAAQAVR